MLTTAIGIDIVYLAANEETPDLSRSNDAKVNYPNIPEAQMHRKALFFVNVAIFSSLSLLVFA